MSNLTEYAREELRRIGMIDSGNPYNEAVTKAILDLIDLLDQQGHSGFTASYTINTFNRLAKFKPLSPLTGKDDEWNDIGDGKKQNKRYSAVFKDEDGTAYNIEGKVFTDDGEIWYTSRDSRVNVTFPYIVPDKPEHVYKNKENVGMTYGNGELPNGGWIPVTERMPEFNDIVLASTDSDYDELKIILTIYNAEEYWFNGKVKAWMPLPEPYKESEK